MNVLDLFSGIGGFSLGLERAGMKTVAFCEIEPYCRAVLKKHWPEVPCYDDIKTLTAAKLATDGIHADIIAGGFPCQDISTAGKRQGIEGKRSGLWKEFYRLICEIRPRYAIVENVAALRSNGLSVILSDLATLGYDSEWHCIPASALGAPHRRDRIWIVAYPRRECCDGRSGKCRGQETSGTRDRTARSGEHTINVAYSDSQRQLQQEGRERDERRWAGNGGQGLADADKRDAQGQFASFIDQEIRRRQEQRQAGSCADGCGWWAVEPSVGELVNGASGGLVRFNGRAAQGVQDRVAKLKALGNSVVPQIPEIIGKAIMAEEFA